MGRIKRDTPYRRKHSSFATSEKEYQELHIVCKSLDVKPSTLIRDLIAAKFRELSTDRYLNLDLKDVQNGN